MKTKTMNGPSGARARMLLSATVVAVAACWSLPSSAQPVQGGASRSEPAMHQGMGEGMRHGMHERMHQGGGMWMGGGPERVGRRIDRMLDGLSATDAQRAQIKQIALAAAADLKTQHDSRRGLRERGLQLFTAPNVDANAVEALRQQMLAQHDQASRRMTQAMLDISRVLTPEQRAKLGERIKARQAQMQERMERMHREHPASAPR